MPMKYFCETEILIPQNVENEKWSVVACDQYTSEPEYWRAVEDYVKDAPSTLKITFPEIYLSEPEGRIEKINRTMEKYIKENIFRPLPDSMIYVERSVGHGRVRRGIVGAIDLEDYDFKKGSSSLIRATEGTVLERIPPRVKIRENAPMELPHIMLLIDDPEKTVIEPIAEHPGKLLYDFDLMQNSGHLTGYQLEREQQERVQNAIAALADPARFEKKYPGKPVLLFAVGDGNHSLATAKTCWESVKRTLTPEEQKSHPARFALAELVNLHDSSLEFEPIHRVVFGVDPEKLLKALKAYYPDTSATDNGGQHITCRHQKKAEELYIRNGKSSLPVGTLQVFLDEYLQKNGGRVDYVHGADVVERLSDEPGNVGFFLPAMQKSDLFKTVILDGALPRKTFSMGEAWEKRFYYEAKMIRSQKV